MISRERLNNIADNVIYPIVFLVLFCLSVVYATTAAAQGIRLTWDNSVEVDTYTIYHQVNTIDQAPITITGNNSEYIYPDLENGVHVFRISATDGSYESVQSDPVGKLVLELVVKAELVD